MIIGLKFRIQFHDSRIQRKNPKQRSNPLMDKLMYERSLIVSDSRLERWGIECGKHMFRSQVQCVQASMHKLRQFFCLNIDTHRYEDTHQKSWRRCGGFDRRFNGRSKWRWRDHLWRSIGASFPGAARFHGRHGRILRQMKNIILLGGNK